MPAAKRPFGDTLDRAKHELANHDASKFSEDASHLLSEIACDQLSYILRESLQAARDDGSELVLVKHIQIALGRLVSKHRRKKPKVSILVGTTLIAGGLGIVLQPGLENYNRAYWYLGVAVFMIIIGVYAVGWGFNRE